MRAFLLDADVLIALAWPRHEAHVQAGRWFARHSRSGWATCPFTEAAFVRILSNPAFAPEALTPTNGMLALQRNLDLAGHQFWPDDVPLLNAVRSIKTHLVGHRQVTDAYLLGLAIHQRGKLATVDARLASWAPEDVVEVIS